MKSAPLPPNEKQRLAELYSYCVLDTDPELGFDDLTEIAAKVCQTPIALVSLIDKNRQWFKSRHGLNASETPRDLAFCAHAILDTVPLVVRDASLDERFADNPLVTGEPHVQFYAGVPLINPEGTALGTLCVIDHIPRELNEMQLDVLQRLARQVVNVLELRRTRNDAIQAARAKTDFLATMSHEIRTPLNGVLGMTDLLSETPMTAAQRDSLSIIKRSGELLLTVVNDILDFSKLESGRVQLECIPFSLDEIVNETFTLMQEHARKANIEYKLQWLSTQPAKRLGDPHRMRQVLINLISNAIKFTTKGSVTVTVSDGEPASCIVIKVTDTGIGIAADAINKLFNRFAQADSSTTRRFGGTGLGLAITKQIVMLMDGQIDVTSQPRVGSEFKIMMPLPVVEVAPAKVELVAQEAPPELSDKFILVAEDDEINATLITQILSRYGPQVTLVGNGVAAVAACQKQKFDLILMDCMMPDLDGYEATSRIRNMGHEWCKAVPIIALTANALQGDRERCLLAGMSDYVTKPIRRVELEAALKRSMSKKEFSPGKIDYTKVTTG